MTGWLISLMSIEVLLLAVPHLTLRIEPKEGSLAGERGLQLFLMVWRQVSFIPPMALS